MLTSRKVHNLDFQGPAGRLEALLDEPEGKPREAWLVCHPHPLYGGTMRNKVVHRIARGLNRAGAVVLRFNFRGVGRSEGMHDHGAGEIEDAQAALAYLRSQYPGIPFSLAGFSFGSKIILNLGCPLAETKRLVAVGFPVGTDSEALKRCTARKIFIQSTHDSFGPRDALEALFREIPEPKQLIWIEAADHFFVDSLDRLEEAAYGVGLSPGD